MKEWNTEKGVTGSSVTPFGQCVESLRSVKTSTYLPVLAPSVNTINTCPAPPRSNLHTSQVRCLVSIINMARGDNSVIGAIQIDKFVLNAGGIRLEIEYYCF